MASIPTDNRIAAVLIGATMLGLWTWWALGEGAFFGTVLLPGAIVAYLVLIVVVLFARLPISPHGLHVLALTALLALAAWTAVSIVWSPAPDLAADYAQRTAVYAACFALGLTLVVSLRRRMLLSIAPLLGAGLHHHPPAALQRFLEQRRQHVLDRHVLQMVEQDLGHFFAS